MKFLSQNMRYYTAIIALLLFANCAQDGNNESFEIKGKIENLEDLNKVYVVYPNEDFSKMDTLVESDVVDDTFYLKGSVEFPLLAKLVFTSPKKRTRTFPLIVENHSMKIRGSSYAEVDIIAGEWYETIFNQFKYNPEYAEERIIDNGYYVLWKNAQAPFYKHMRSLIDKGIIKSIDDLGAEDKAKKAKVAELGNLRYKHLINSKKIKAELVSKEFKTTDDTFFKVLLALNYWGEIKASDDEINTIIESLGKEHYYAKQLAHKVERRAKDIAIEKSIEIGKTVQHFEVFNNLKETIASKDVIENNKYTLIEFWASWCGPCIKEIPNLKKAYAKYNKKGFEILSISVDAKRNKWTEEAQKQNLPYIDAWAGENRIKLKELFGIKYIPFNLLVDSNGKILAAKLRNKQLDEKLKALYSKK